MNFKQSIIKLLNLFLSRVGLYVIPFNKVNYINLNLRGDELSNLSKHVPLDKLNYIYPFFNYNGELAQDLFALVVSKFKNGGFFVEFGATDGITGSNTYMLETKFNWRGILVEPLDFYFEKLSSNRSCFCHHGVVSDKSNFEFKIKPARIPSFSKIDNTKNGQVVKSISLIDLLDRYNSPIVIDFLSIDVEGHEYIILESFPWGIEKYKILFICVEHNRDIAIRKKIYRLLTSNNYFRVFKDKSYIDDYYILKDYLNELPTSILSEID